MIAALEGGEWSAALPDRTLLPGNTCYPFYRRLGGPQGRSGRAKNLVPTGIRSRTVQPVAQLLYWLSYPTHTQSNTESNCLAYSNNGGMWDDLWSVGRSGEEKHFLPLTDFEPDCTVDRPHSNRYINWCNPLLETCFHSTPTKHKTDQNCEHDGEANN